MRGNEYFAYDISLESFFPQDKTFFLKEYFEETCDWRTLSDMEIATASFFIRFTFLVFLLLLVQFRLSLSCSGSTNVLDKRGPRKPLMPEQFVPDTPENSQQASGPSKGKITRNSPEFDKLNLFYRNAIIFKNEEGAGADRLMPKVAHLSFVYIFYLALNLLNAQHFASCEAYVV